MVPHHTTSPRRYQCLAQAIQPDQTSSCIKHAPTRPRNLIRETKNQWANLGGWTVIDSPFARAHEYLSKIDLFAKDNEKGLKIGDLDFVAPGGLGYSDHCGVFSEDPITASLLQARLIELGHYTSVEIVDA